MKQTPSLKHPFAELLCPVVEAAGFEMVHCETDPARRILRLYIDHGGGIGCDECQAASRLVSDWLDALGEEALGGWPGGGWLRGGYTLEVSSPGLDRPLVTPEHFARHLGAQVAVESREPLDTGGRRRVSGRLAAADQHRVQIEAEGGAFAVAYANMARARLVPNIARGG